MNESVEIEEVTIIPLLPSPAARTAELDAGYSKTIETYPFVCDSFRWLVAISANYSQAVFWHNQDGGLFEKKNCMLVRTK